MKKYRTWFNDIEEIEIIRETEQCVFVPSMAYKSNERREAKRSDHVNYFNTWKEAHQFLLDRENVAIKGCERQIAQHRETLKKLQEMSQP
jgi:uncharacterized protein YciI